MAAMSDVLENAFLDLILRNVSLAASGITTGSVYAALFTTPTSDTTGSGGSGEEVSGGGYARTQITGFSVAADGNSSNSVTITFPSATSGWGTVTHFGLFDAATGGNLLFHGELTAPKVVNAGDSFVFPSGNITISLD